MEEQHYQNTPFHLYLNQSGLDEDLLVDPNYPHSLSDDHHQQSDSDDVIAPHPPRRSKHYSHSHAYSHPQSKEADRFTELLKYSLATSALLHPHLVDALPLYPLPTTKTSTTTPTTPKLQPTPLQWGPHWDTHGLSLMERSPLKNLIKFLNQCLSLVTKSTPSSSNLLPLPGAWPSPHQEEDEGDHHEDDEEAEEKKVYAKVLREVDSFVECSQKLDLRIARAVIDINYRSGGDETSWDSATTSTYQPPGLTLVLSEVLSTTTTSITDARIALRTIESNFTGVLPSKTPVINSEQEHQSSFFTSSASASSTSASSFAFTSDEDEDNSDADEADEDDFGGIYRNGPETPTNNRYRSTIRNRREHSRRSEKDQSRYQSLSLKALQALGDSALPPPPTPDLRSRSPVPASSPPSASIPSLSSSASSSASLQTSFDNLHQFRRGLLWRLLGVVDKKPSLPLTSWTLIGGVLEGVSRDLSGGIGKMEDVFSFGGNGDLSVSTGRRSSNSFNEVRRTASLNRGAGVGGGRGKRTKRPLSLSFASTFSIQSSPMSASSRATSPLPPLSSSSHHLPSTPISTPRTLKRHSLKPKVGYSTPTPISPSSSISYSPPTSYQNFAPPNPNALSASQLKKQKWSKAVSEMKLAMNKVFEIIDLDEEDEIEVEKYEEVRGELERLVRAWEEGGVALGLGRGRKRDSFVRVERKEGEGEREVEEDRESSGTNSTLFETDDSGVGLGLGIVGQEKLQEELQQQPQTTELVFEATVGEGDSTTKKRSTLSRDERIKRLKEQREDDGGKRDRKSSSVDPAMITELRDVLGMLKARSKLPKDF